MSPILKLKIIVRDQEMELSMEEFSLLLDELNTLSVSEKFIKHFGREMFPPPAPQNVDL